MCAGAIDTAKAAGASRADAPQGLAAAPRPERIAGEAPEGRETILDRVVDLHSEVRTEIPEIPSWCDRLDLVSRRVDVGGAELHVEEEGEGPALVLLHGGPGGTHHVFHPWFSRAAAFSRVLYYDQRGCGRSDFEPGPGGYSVDQAVQDLEALREKLEIDRWVLFGFSYGGALAQLYTVRHPERVAGLVLHSALPPLRADLGASRQGQYLSPEETARKKEILDELRRLREERNWSVAKTTRLLVYNWVLNGDWKRQSFFKPTAEEVAQRALYEWSHDDGFNDIMSRSLQEVDLTGAFDSLSVPTLVLEGEWDLTWGEGKAKILAANHPGARYLLFDHAGHGIFREQPEALFAILEDFVTGLESR